MGKSIGVVSLKGGVGKTSSVAALGSAMAELGKKTLLIDGNFSAPNLGIHLDILNPNKTIHDVLDNSVKISDSIHKIGELLHLMPASVSHNSRINPLHLRNKIKNTKRRYDATIIDSSPNLDEETLGVMTASDYILVVTTPDYPTLSNTIKAVRVARQRGTPIAGLILNKVYGKNFELSLDDIEKSAEVPVMAVVPHDIQVLKALSQGVPSTIYKPKSRASREYKRLAATLVGEKDEPVKLKKAFRWINPKKQDINREIFYDRVFN